MKEYALIIFSVIALNSIPAKGQVKPEYLFNPSRPEKLDIRTTISASTYYYLREGETFSFRESAPGVKTNSYKQFTKWDSSPYRQGHLRYKNGSSDRFVMNYRLLPPLNYSDTFSTGYPLIVLLHGGIERANCSFHNCYHSTWDYDPNLNAPKASTSPTHPLLNNDHHLKFGGEEHLNARNLAGMRLPNDPSLPPGSFAGFVLAPQMLNDWDTESVQHMLRILQLHIRKYNIDQNRIYVHGLSVGGFAVYEALTKAPWMFAAAIPICAAKDTEVTENKVTPLITNIPIWIFQGSADPEPSVEITKSLMDRWKSMGGSVKYTEYPGLDHSIWNMVYSEPEFFSWLKLHDKANLHLFSGINAISREKKIFPKLILSPGFYDYQWERDGQILNHSAHELVATAAGTYRARFSRIPHPKDNDWNKWSEPVVIREASSTSDVEEPKIVEDRTNEIPTPTRSSETVNKSTAGAKTRAENAAGL